MAFNTNGAATAGPKGLFSIDPLDVRLQVKLKADLAGIKAGTVYESIIVFCQEDKKFYTPKDYATTAADADLTWQEVNYGGTWGKIDGTLADQTDLNTELTNIKNDISKLQTRGRFLSLWDSKTGKPVTEPESEDAFEYKTGDYFIVSNVSVADSLDISQTVGDSLSNLVVDKAAYKAKVNPVTDSTFVYTLVSEEGAEEEEYAWKLGDATVDLTEYGITFEGTPVANDTIAVVYTAVAVNYKPDGTSYTKGQPASTVTESDEVAIDDTYYFDGTNWNLQINHGKAVTFANLEGKPEDNAALAEALEAKEDNITFDYSTTKEVGGLPKNTDISDWTIEQLLKQILHPTAVTEPTLSLTNKASTSGVAGSTHTFAKDTVVATLGWTAGTSTNPGAYTLTGTDKDKFYIDGTNVKLLAAETFTAGTTSTLTFGVSRTYDIINSLGKKVSKTAKVETGSLSYSATYPSYVGTTTDAADTFIAAVTSAISLPDTFTQKETQNSAYTSYTIPDKEMLTYTNRLVIINKGSYTKITDASGDITGNFNITSKTLDLDGTATATYTIAVLINPSAGYKDTLTIS